MARVLVVDDNDDERRLYAQMLYYNGFDVIQAENPVDGLELARHEQPDLILMDYRMPQMDGLTATEILRSKPDTALIPVVCLTGHEVTERQVRASGCQELIRKPARIHELVHRVRTYVDALEDQCPGACGEE